MRMKEEMQPYFGLKPGTYCPFNNQNTAITRDVLPGYYTPYTALRFSDLFPAYVICRIAEQMNHVISYGYPFVRQLRNPHNLWSDVLLEVVGAQCAETIIKLLRSAELTGKTYHECLGELNVHFSKNMDQVKGVKYKGCEINISITSRKKRLRVFKAISTSPRLFDLKGHCGLQPALISQLRETDSHL